MAYRWFSPISPEPGKFAKVVVPDGVEWRVIIAGCVIETGPTVTPKPRIANIEFQMPDGLWVYWRYNIAKQPENTAHYYFWVAGDDWSPAGFERAFYTSLPDDLWLPARSVIQLSGERIQGDDRIRAIRFYVEER